VLTIGLCANGGSKVFLDLGRASFVAADLRCWPEVLFWKTKTEGYQPNGLGIGCSTGLKTCKCLISSDAENGKIAAN
jgi:hypothetical protein